MSLAAVIFDVDGTLADTEAVQLLAVNGLLEPHGFSITPEEWATQYVGTPIQQDLSRMREKYQLPLSLEELIRQRHELYSTLVASSETLQPVAGLEALLDELDARHITYGLASGSPQADIEHVLRVLGLDHRFRAIAAGDHVTYPKPAPDVYLLAASLLHLTPSDCVAIEDSASGIAAARAAGMRVIGIPNDFTRYQNLSDADVILPSMADVMQWLFNRYTA